MPEELSAAVQRIEAAIVEACSGKGSVDFAHAKVQIADLRLVLTALERLQAGGRG